MSYIEGRGNTLRVVVILEGRCHAMKIEVIL